MTIGQVISWKMGGTSGVRTFSERAYAERRVLKAGGSLNDLYEAAADCFVYWPPALGAFPDAATLQAWAQEYDAETARGTTIDSGIATAAIGATQSATVAQLKAMTGVQYSSWFDANFDTAAKLIALLKWLVRIVIRRVL